MPRDMVLMGDGSIGLLTPLPATLVRVTPTGEPLSSIRYESAGGELCLGFAAFARGSHLVFSLAHEVIDGTAQTTHLFLEKISLEGHPLARLHGVALDFDRTHLSFSEAHVVRDFIWRSALGPHGKMYVAPQRDRYAIHIYNPDGSVARVIEREYEHRRRTQHEIDRIYNVMERMLAGAPFEVAIEAAQYDSDIGSWRRPSLRVTDGGELWVLASRGCHDQPEGILQTFDVFSPEGHYIKQVAVACEGDGIYDGLFFLGDDRVVQVTRIADSMMAAVFQSALPETDDDEEVAPVMVRCLRVAESR
jgi:hypothetical protein